MECSFLTEGKCNKTLIKQNALHNIKYRGEGGEGNKERVASTNTWSEPGPGLKNGGCLFELV